MRVEIQTCDGCGIEDPGGLLGMGNPMMPQGLWMGITTGCERALALGLDQDPYVCSLDCLVVVARKLRGFTVDPEMDPLELAFANPAAAPVRKPPAPVKRPAK